MRPSKGLTTLAGRAVKAWEMYAVQWYRELTGNVRLRKVSPHSIFPAPFPPTALPFPSQKPPYSYTYPPLPDRPLLRPHPSTSSVVSFPFPHLQAYSNALISIPPQQGLNDTHATRTITYVPVKIKSPGSKVVPLLRALTVSATPNTISPVPLPCLSSPLTLVPRLKLCGSCNTCKACPWRSSS